MDSSIDWDRLLLTLLYIAAPLAIVGAWLIHRGRERQAFRRAERCFEAGRYREAVGHLGMAEQAWRYNKAHSTPRTVVRDTARLVEIVERISEAASRAGVDLESQPLLDALGERMRIYGNRSNFKFGTFTLKPEVAARDNQIEEALSFRRHNFRAAYRRVRDGSAA